MTQKNARILPFHENCCRLWSMPRNYKSFFPPENWDPYADFECKKVSVRFKGAEIFAKQNEVSDKDDCINSNFYPLGNLKDD